MGENLKIAQKVSILLHSLKFESCILYYIQKIYYFFVKILKPVEHHRRIACCPHYIDG